MRAPNPVSPDRVLKNKILLLITDNIPGTSSSLSDNLLEYSTAYFSCYQEEFPRHASCIAIRERRSGQEVLLLPNSGKGKAGLNPFPCYSQDNYLEKQQKNG